MKPADLRPGHRIRTGGPSPVVVVEDPVASLGRIFVDVTPESGDHRDRWDVFDLAAAVGAEEWTWTRSHRTVFRLTFRPEANVTIGA